MQALYLLNNTKIAFFQRLEKYTYFLKVILFINYKDYFTSEKR